VSETWSFSLADPRAGLYCFATRGRALNAADGTRAAAGLDGEGPFTVAVDGIGEFTLEPLGAPAVFEREERREWICKLVGTPGGYGAVARGADLDGLARRRSFWVCVEDALAVSGIAEATDESAPHGAEALEVHLARGMPLVPGLVADPRLSSSYDAEGRVLRAGLELWEEEIDEERERGGALRLAGESVASAQVEGLNVAFLRWHQAERSGTGCYAIERAG
jgi:hypothetical protein